MQLFACTDYHSAENSAAAVERCRREIAEIEAELRAGHGDMHGRLLGLKDWSAELRLLLEAERAA